MTAATERERLVAIMRREVSDVDVWLEPDQLADAILAAGYRCAPGWLPIESEREVLGRLTARLSEATALLESYDKGKAYIPEFREAIEAGNAALNAPLPEPPR